MGSGRCHVQNGHWTEVLLVISLISTHGTWSDYIDHWPKWLHSTLLLLTVLSISPTSLPQSFPSAIWWIGGRKGTQFVKTYTNHLKNSLPERVQKAEQQGNGSDAVHMTITMRLCIFELYGAIQILFYYYYFLGPLVLHSQVRSLEWLPWGLGNWK